MPFATQRFRAPAQLIAQSLLFLGLCLFGSGCKATQSWWQGDFRIDLQGKPEPLTHLYLVVGSEAALNKAQATGEGFGGIILGQRGDYAEFYEFKLEADERLGRKWVPKHDERREGLERLTEQEEKGAGLGGQLRLKISRKGFKANADHRIAIIAKYRSEDPWQGTMIPMQMFTEKARAIVTLSDSELNVYYSDRVN